MRQFEQIIHVPSLWRKNTGPMEELLSGSCFGTNFTSSTSLTVQTEYSVLVAGFI